MGRTPRRLVADTSFLVAVHNPDDTHHDAAVAMLQQLDSHPFQMIINPFIFAETVTVLAMRAHRALASATGELLLTDPQVLALPSEEHFSQRTWEIFVQVSKKDTSFADCSIVTALEYTNTHVVLTFDDDDFKPLQRQFGFEIFAHTRQELE